LTLALDAGEWQASRPSLLDPGNHWIGGWVGLTAGLDAEGKEKEIPFLP